MTPASLEELKAIWLSAKQREREAANERLLAEEAMLALLPSKTEGTVSDKAHGISVAFKVNRKVDTEKLQAAWHDLPAEAHRAFTWKADVNTTFLKSLQELDPPAYSAVAAFITATPAKPGFTIKE